jgi:hypothetical protein
MPVPSCPKADNQGVEQRFRGLVTRQSTCALSEHSTDAKRICPRAERLAS